MRITASQIVDWVNTKSKEAQTNLPRLIRRLSFDAAFTRQVSFPAGDSTFVPGWDGLLVREQGNAWAPQGRSYWEIGCDQSPSSKANSDYKKRLAQISKETRITSTFILVTPRRWTRKTQWISKQRAKKEWADVRVYDADDLEQWLEQMPAVALQFAEELGLIGSGVESLERHWHVWSQQSNPVITQESFFHDRTATRDHLIAKIRSALESQDVIPPLMIRADSVEEAAAFTVAALLEINELSVQSLVVDSSDGWRFVEANQQIRIVIATRTEYATRPSLRVGLIVVVPYMLGDKTSKVDDHAILLERPNIYEFEKSLITLGMEESDAKRYALSTGRSWTVLRRQRATNEAIRNPAWLDSHKSQSLSLLCLLGAWNADKSADQQVVARLADRVYEDVEQDLRHLALLDDSPVLRIGAIWKAKSPLELLSLFGERITKGQLERFFLIAREMLVAPDPQLDLPHDQRFAAAVYGKVHPFSGLLFDSICDALVKLAVRGLELPSLRDLDIEQRVARFVHELLDEADAERWLSLASHLPMLAEAAPTEFLSSIEKSLQLPDQPVASLIRETSASGVGGRCWHAGLLWALETLAWAPNRLARVALILAKLSHIQMEGNWGNTPAQSLFGLFRSWLPMTAAGIQDRIKVLDLVIKKDPDIGFDILEGLTSALRSQTAMNAARPKWREDDSGAGRSVTYAEMFEMQDEAKERMLQLSAGHPSRIAALLTNTRKNGSNETLRVLALMQPFTLPAARDEDKEVLRIALRKIIHWHRNYDDARTDLLEAWLMPIEQQYGELAPTNLVQRHNWLFNSHWVDLPEKENKPTSPTRQTALSELRLSALKEIIHSLGIDGIIPLIESCLEPGSVGEALASMNHTDTQWSSWFVRVGADFEQGSQATTCIRGFLHAVDLSRANELLEEVIELSDQGKWRAEKRANFLLLARSNQETWQLVSACGSDADTLYWDKVRPDYYLRSESDDLLFAFNRLLLAKRPKTALRCIQYSLDRIEATLLYSALQQFMKGEELDGPRLESWHLGEMIEFLEKSNSIEKMALIQLEFTLFPALGYGQEARASALYAGLMSEPSLFTDLICLRYKPENGERTEPITDDLQAAAGNAWQILHHCTRQPGIQEDGNVDPLAFTSFIEATRELCRKADRSTMCDQTLGQILAYASVGEDGISPSLPARDTLDSPELTEMRKGFYVGTINKRGGTTRSLWEGGGQERDLAAYYRTQSNQLQHSHPNLSATLENLAKNYELDGKREDTDANLRKEGY